MSMKRQGMDTILGFEEQNYYELLEVDYQAPPAEIKRFYHFALKSFGANSLASYSLFSQREREVVLNRVDEAYKTLIDIQKRRMYDEELIREHKWPKELLEKREAEMEGKRGGYKRKVDVPEPVAPLSEEKRKLLTSMILSIESEMGYNGASLKKVRELRGIDLNEIAFRTKISKNYLKYIEGDQYEFLPPEVYVKGFVSQFASILELNPEKVVASFVECMRAGITKK